MIAILTGKVIQKKADYVVLTVNGVGYRIFLPLSALSIIQLGEEREVFTYLHVREDALLLFGFLKENDKEIFVKLLGISGLGPKTALAVISHLTETEFLKALQENDVTAFAKVPGIGKKTAQRIILELKGKLEFNDENGNGANQLGENCYLATEALVGLGYNKADVKNTLVRIQANLTGDASPEVIIKAALKFLAKV